MWLQSHFETSFCLRIKAFILVYQPERIRISLMSPWWSPWFFGRVNFISLTIHTFFFTSVFIFLTLMNSTEEGNICRPPPGEEFLGWIFSIMMTLLTTPGIKLMGTARLDRRQRGGGNNCEGRGFWVGKKKSEEENLEEENWAAHALKEEKNLGIREETGHQIDFSSTSRPLSLFSISGYFLFSTPCLFF